MPLRRRPPLALCLGLLAGLSACATYEEPQDGPIAHLVLSGAMDSVSLGTAGQCGAMQTVDARQGKALRIRGGGEITLSASPHGPRSSTCIGNLAFLAQAGYRYELMAEYLEGRGCRVTLWQQSPGSSSWQGDPTLRVLDSRRCLPWDK